VTYLDFQIFKRQRAEIQPESGPPRVSESSKFAKFPVDMINRKAKQDGPSGEIYVPLSESETRRDPENWITREVRREGAER
jgi:hypothetical protein